MSFDSRVYEIVARIEDEGNPEKLDGEVRPQLFTKLHRMDKPWRDPEKLERAADKHDSISAIADEWDCHDGNIGKWYAIFGIQRPYGKGDHRKGLAKELLESEPEDFGLPPAEPEGSA